MKNEIRPSGPQFSVPSFPATLDQNRSTIDHKCLASSESFLHQEQIGLGYVMWLADSAHGQTLSNALIHVFSLRCAHVLPEVRPNDSGGHRVDANWRQLHRHGTC